MQVLVGAALIVFSFGGLSAIVASRRGHNPIYWYLVGSILGPIGLGLALGLHPRKKGQA